MIKFSIISILFIVFQTNCHFKENRTAYIDSEEGLILRDQPTRKANKILVIPNNAQITILDSSIIPDRINEKKGNWIKVKYMDYVGYVFDAYLTFDHKVNSQRICNNSEYQIKNLKDTNYKIKQNQTKIASIENVDFLEFKNSKNGNYLIAKLKDKYFSSNKNNEKIFGKFKKLNDFLVSEWDDTKGDFAEAGYNLYFSLNDKISYIKFYPILNSPTCYHSVVASYAYPKVENRIINKILISKVSYPECDFENPPENFGPDNPVEIIPQKYKRESLLKIEFDSEQIKISEFCDKEIDDDIQKLWEDGKSLNLRKL